MIDPCNYENDYYEEETKPCKKRNKRCCIDLAVVIILAALTFTIGLIIGAVASTAILGALAAIIVLAVVIALLLVLRIVILICNKKC